MAEGREENAPNDITLWLNKQTTGDAIDVGEPVERTASARHPHGIRTASARHPHGIRLPPPPGYRGEGGFLSATSAARFASFVTGKRVKFNYMSASATGGGAGAGEGSARAPAEEREPEPGWPFNFQTTFSFSFEESVLRPSESADPRSHTRLGTYLLTESVAGFAVNFSEGAQGDAAS
ncbi:hypothetical protein EYF80_049657 [Liparis tanakae]|uniref:Uncharacterized protein n=1 Tax=Liparis tanakae TaxID=230148 RepID=A0A4Z2FHC5_9TELE|nr:hypothetical protein EYF80_049657 [Liparis tanakae]